MTKLVEKVFSEVSKRPEVEQDAIAAWLLEEVDAIRTYDSAKNSLDEVIPFEHAVRRIEKSRR